MSTKRAGVAAVLLFVLTACGGEPSPSDPSSDVRDETGVVEVLTPDGRTVQCVVWNDYRSGGLDCDWAGAQ